MVLKDKLTMIISSCDKFSDLWDAHVGLLDRNWQDRGIDTYILTDSKHASNYDNVKIFSAGDGKEMSERLETILPLIETEYVFITLDDYFLIKKVDSSRISEIISYMDSKYLDYVRLFHLPNSHVKMKGCNGLYNVNLYKSQYAVNFYAGIWRKSFLTKTIKGSMNAWQYEVSLTQTARRLNAKCAMTKGREFVILDVVRKGKILTRANNYFKKNPVYHGSRDIMKKRDEFVLSYRTWAKRILPKRITQAFKRRMINNGYKFYSGIE